MGVTAFETWAIDSHTEYFGKDHFQTESEPMYESLAIAENSNIEKFKHDLQIHQQGKTDYFAFYKDCAETGIEKWVVCFDAMTCTYYDKAGKEIPTEKIPE